MSVTLADRLATLEKQNIAYDLLLRTLEKQDTATPHEVARLTDKPRQAMSMRISSASRSAVVTHPWRLGSKVFAVGLG